MDNQKRELVTKIKVMQNKQKVTMLEVKFD
jgi:hypothetical protein